MRTQGPKPEIVSPATGPAAEGVIDLSGALNGDQDTYLAFVATGMDPFEAIEPAAQGDRTVAAHLWMEAMRLVEIPAGTFKMGSTTTEKGYGKDEVPQHEVTFTRPFRIGVVPASQGCWEAIMGFNPSHYQGDPALPVERVPWNDICGRDGFMSRLNTLTEGARPDGMVFRLPSEAEWEYVCRAGTATAYSFGDDADALKDYGWFGDNSDGKTHPVGQKKPNAWGLHDLHGNVWEWCADIWHEDYLGAPKDGSAWMTGDDRSDHILRGGSWQNDDYFSRSANRLERPAGLEDYTVGFRVVLAASDSGYPA